MEDYAVETEIGKFRVTKTTHYNYRNEYDYEMLKVGGKDYCIEYRFKKGKVELQWIDKDNKICTLDHRELGDKKTVFFFYLSVELLKTYVSVSKILLLDDSHINCKLPDDSIISIHLQWYYFLFHGKTWYEEKFEAYPDPAYHPDLIGYENTKQNLRNPKKKPKDFDFINDDLNRIFVPIYESTATWYEFFYKIKDMRDRCSLVSLWYKNAMRYILDAVIPQYWIIDVNDATKIEYIKRKLRANTKNVNYRDNSNYVTYVPQNRNSSKMRFLKDNK